MKMTIDLDENVVKQLMEITKAKNLNEAINIALEHYIKINELNKNFNKIK